MRHLRWILFTGFWLLLNAGVWVCTELTWTPQEERQAQAWQATDQGETAQPSFEESEDEPSFEMDRDHVAPGQPSGLEAPPPSTQTAVPVEQNRRIRWQRPPPRLIQ